MLMFILPVLIATTLFWAGWASHTLWRAIPRSNADFELAGGGWNAPPRENPASAFYEGSALARVLGAALRLIDALAPRWGTQSALGLFFTPLPWKFARRRSLPDRWETFAWRFESVNLAAYRRRALEPGRPIVLLVHGWAGSGAQMARLGDALADAGFDPVLLDFPGHGHSGGWRSTLPQFSRAIFAAASRLGPFAGIVGHSLGAVAAMHAVARGLPAQRLVLVAPSASPALFLRWFAGSFRLADSIPARMQRRIESREDTRLGEFEPEWLGPRIGQPTLVVHDEDDRIAPMAAAARVVSALRAARLHPTRGLGHARVLDDASVAEAVLDHLRR